MSLTTLGQETRWASSTPPPSPHGAANLAPVPENSMFCYGPLVSELGGPECMVPPNPVIGGGGGAHPAPPPMLDIILNAFYINSYHHLKRSVRPTISVPVAMASPSLLYRQSSCAKTFCTVCCTMIYIIVKTCVIFFADIVIYIVCLLC